jgi:mRNA deadenylase 3'-5' endonuclease subunit Ccr4
MVRVAQYNILCAKLASKERFPKCDGKSLVPSFRLKSIFNKLKGEIDQNSVICLQELGRSWYGDFHDFFQKHKYYIIYSSYSSWICDYMGVAIAYPMEKYVSEHTQIVKISDNVPKVKSHLPASWWYSYINNLLIKLNLVTKKPYNEWLESSYRSNTCIMTTLSLIDNPSEKFVVSTYHMPCAFYYPKVMTIHVVELLKAVYKYAKESPLILAGDFNILPTSYQYKIITTGYNDIKHCDEPDISSVLWDYAGVSLKSAYAVFDKEPVYTNHAWVENQPNPFTETIDYIFHSSHFQTINVGKIPPCEKDDPFPNMKEPSDHVMITADLDMIFN